MDPVFQRVSDIVAATFNVPVADITAESSPASIEAWDSMGQLTLLLALEQELGISIAPEDGERMVDVAAVVEVVRPLL